MTNDEIRGIFLANGFKIAAGFTDLKPYVYEAARALLDHAEAKTMAADIRCGTCRFFSPLQDRAKIGKCVFLAHQNLPIWMSPRVKESILLGYDEMHQDDGRRCAAWAPPAP